jgi:hypothetical protein
MALNLVPAVESKSVLDCLYWRSIAVMHSDLMR